ncbi:MAG: lanthionine synthetase LanC family protein [Terracidiphilus sp.]
MTDFADIASAIARRICRDAIWAGDACNWIGPFADSWNSWEIRHRSLGPELYSGTSGVALFLASVAQIDSEPLLRKTALGAAAHCFRQALDLPRAMQIGVYSGALGIAWSLIRIGEALAAPEWQDRGVELLGKIDLEAHDAGFDVMSGYAGAIPLLLGFARRFERPAWAQAASRWGQRLEQAATKSPEGWSWKTIDLPAAAAGKNLTGFSHGTAGIGLAFAQLFRATGEIGFQVAAAQAFQYERTFYSAEVENWPDFRDYLRPAGSPPAYGMAWCHGAPGIALSRLRAWQLSGSAQARAEAEIALRTTQRALASPAALNGGFSLCHGCAGNADVLLEASRILNEPQLRLAAEKIGRIGMEKYESQKRPWPCGVPGAGETASLMIGAAGIGHFYLRLADARVPTVLLIE